MIKKIDLLKEKSELVQEVLDRKPSWVIYWGSTILSVIMFIFVFLTIFIRYPDIIRAKITLSNSVPPMPLMAKVNGHIHLFISDGDHVKKNQPLGYILSSTDYNEVINLKARLQYDDFQEVMSTSHLDSLNAYKNLGVLQESFNHFTEALRDLRFYRQFTPIKKQQDAVHSQLAKYQKLDKGLSEKLFTAKRQFELAELTFEREKKLYAKEIISTKDFEKSETELLSSKSMLENIVLEKDRNDVAVAELERIVVDLENQERERISSLEAVASAAFKVFNAQLRQWEENYVFKSPIDGSVSLYQYWKSGQFVNGGSEVMVVAPLTVSEIVGKVECSIYNSGKIKTGQTVNILLDSYPYEEYGMLKGTVKSISLVPRKDVYSLEVSLVNGLVTVYNKELAFKQEMLGSAEIITEDVNLLNRIFNTLYRSIRDNNKPA
jgi:multidrug efflux pump subunit AcrA (membrane-fusion protein)